MVDHIGIVACSAEGAALCYRTICVEGAEYMGRHAHPEVTMHTFPLREYMECIEGDDWEGVAGLMISSVTKVAQIGANFAICPDNTIHQAFDLVIKESPIPWLHIAEEVAKEAKKRAYTSLGVLGTRFLMEGPVYNRLATEGIDYTVPGQEDREKINTIIFDELVYGTFYPDSRAYLNEVIKGLKEKGCIAVVLGCTELPLLVIPEESPLPVLDSTRLLARAALKKAVGTD
jgi:aspartate racemase